VRTSAWAEVTGVDVCRVAGLRAVRTDDRAGFVVHRLLYPYLNDAVHMLASRYARTAAIDTAMTRGCGYPAGPFAVLDALGPRTVRDGLRAIAAETGEPGHVPAPLLEQFVTAGITTTSGWGG
jgi:3-hydroxybutyryl-CoA dehydrogenase